MEIVDEYLQPNKSYLRLIEEYKKHGSLTIGCDFDGTLFDYHKKGTTYDMVIELLKDLKLLGCKIYIWTANENLKNVEQYLVDNSIPFDGINTSNISLGWNTPKPFYNALLDDRAGLLQVYTELKLLVKIVTKELNKPYTT